LLPRSPLAWAFVAHEGVFGVVRMRRVADTRGVERSVPIGFAVR
jgi:hypothetical protein